MYIVCIGTTTSTYMYVNVYTYERRNRVECAWFLHEICTGTKEGNRTGTEEGGILIDNDMRERKKCVVLVLCTCGGVENHDLI